nr:integrase family protein [Sphingomonas sp.]
MKYNAPLSPGRLDSLIEGRLADPQTPGLFVDANRRGRRTWRYRRRLAFSDDILRLTLGLYPTFTLANAREWAGGLNAQIEAGIDPRAVARAEAERTRLTVAYAHDRYMIAVREGRGSRARKINKPRTIADKLAIYTCDIEPVLADRLILDVTEDDLTKLVLAKGEISKVRANRLANELKVFFGWAASLRGKEINLPTNPAARLADLKFPEAPRNRKLNLEEIGWYLRAVALEPLHYKRGMLLWLLTAARISEVIYARSNEYEDGVWVIPADRVKNGKSHRIPLGPWGQSLVKSESEWMFPSNRTDGPRAPRGWYKARDRVWLRMTELAGQPIPKWNPHDLRRTARSNTRRLETDSETAEAMLNHAKGGLARIYDGYEMEEEKRTWFQKWENEIARIAIEQGVAEAFGIPLPEGT